MADRAGVLRGPVLREIWNGEQNHWQKTRDRASSVRRMLAGELRAPIPEGFQMNGADVFRVDMPQKYTTLNRVLNVLAARAPRVVRYPQGVGVRAMSTATKIEQPMNAIMQADAPHGYPWDASVDLLLNEGIAITVPLPMPIFWEKIPSAYAEDGKPNPRFQRDKDGRDADDAYYRENPRRSFRAHGGESAKALREAVSAYKANRLPIVQRALSIQQAAPIFGSAGKVEALIVATSYSVSELIRRKYTWGDDQLMTPAGGETPLGWSDTTAQSRRLGTKTLYEYYGYDDDGRPYVAYCVDGKATYQRRGDSMEEPVHYLDEYGLDELPVAVQWALSWPGHVSLDDRAIPLAWPLMRSWLSADAVATGVAVALWRMGFPTYHAKPDTSAGALPQLEAEDEDPSPLVIEPLTVIRSNDTITQIGGQAPSRDAASLIGLLMGATEEEGPDRTGVSGDGGASAVGMTVARRFTEDSLNQIRKAALELYRQTASHVAAICCAIGRQHGPVEVYEQVETPIARKTDSPTRAVLVLEPKLFGDPPVYALDAEYPRQFGENLAQNQQLADFRDRGILPTDMLLELMGDPNPEITLARVEAEEMRKKDPLWRARMIELVAKIQGDEELAERARLEAEGLVAEATGLPNGLTQGMPPPQMGGMPGGPATGMGPPQMDSFQGDAMSGGGMPNLAASALGGTISGAVQQQAQQRIANAGGVLPADTLAG